MNSREFSLLEFVLLADLVGSEVAGLTAGKKSLTHLGVVSDVHSNELIDTQVKHVVLDGQVRASGVDVEALLVVHKDNLGGEVTL